MKLHEIEMVGRFLLKKEIGSLNWNSAQEGRLVYGSDRNIWYGDNVGWKQLAKGDSTLFAMKNSTNSWTNNQLPNTDNTYTIGSPSYRWSNIYANTFTGTVTTATYADLAEMYKTPVKYPVGTVVKVSDDPQFDIIMAEDAEKNVLGVISSKPGFILNFTKTQDNMQAVGLVGRIPVRIIGPIKKGQAIMSAASGKACVYDGKNSETKIGISLEENLSPAEKLVECSIK